ncbi:chemotaxis protein CheB [Caballeronia sp. LZ033]|uniref:chemotaxis protein CheB n=1 Tax=Caballeronia sp. LZ033 TaxID=3038566 RepID=UPI002866196C|nr:chemotaxis protein CheB [Caballeronia sp. LZ033]MDR5815123.1 chemotaxis protein CheB [Caballeronia sp. LZ033]
MAERDIVVIGASRGGFQGLKVLISQLPADLPAALFVVLHIGRHASVLPELMTSWGRLPARYAGHGEPIERGTVCIAPPDRHLVLSQGRMWLNDGAKENFARPAVDPLFRSAAMEYGARVIGVVMSGDLDDGAVGLANIRAQSGFAIVQDPDDCEATGMPRAALESCGADRLCTEEELAECIRQAVKGGPSGEAPAIAQANKPMYEKEALIAASGLADLDALDEVGERSALTCPDCGGALWRVRGDRPLRYRCHTGHAFTGMSLAEGIESRSEEAIWSAIRAVHERVIFARERQQWAERAGDGDQIAIEQARIDEAERLAELLRAAMHTKPSSSESPE